MVPRGIAEGVLGGVEDVVPQPRLQVALELGQVEVGTGSAPAELGGVVEEVEAEVQQARRHRLAVHEDVPLLQVPPPWPDHEHRGPGVERVRLALGGGERQRPPHRRHQVGLSRHDVGPGRREGVLEVRHEDLRPRVEGVDHHLGLHRPGDLHGPLLQVGGDGRDAPVGLADPRGGGGEGGERAGRDLTLAVPPRAQQLLAPRVECPVQPRHELHRLRGQDLLRSGNGASPHLDAVW